MNNYIKLNEDELKMYRVYLETSGNKPLVFGGGSPNGSASEDLSGVHFVNGTRRGNPELVNLAKKQVGNVGGYPYWSWYAFSRLVVAPRYKAGAPFHTSVKAVPAPIRIAAYISDLLFCKIYKLRISGAGAVYKMNAA